MTLLFRVIKSLQDGSFAFKVLNRMSQVKYIPGPEKAIKEFLERSHPVGDCWRTWSMLGRKTWMQLHSIFDDFEIRIIVYVGAYDGTIALAINEVFPGCEFYLFEPVPRTFDILVEKTRMFKNIHCFNVAIGSQDEERQMLVDEFSPASSLLSYEPVAIKEYPFLGKQSKVNVHVRPLDSIMREQQITDVDLMVMDVQGYENEVIAGAVKTLKSVDVVISELSLKALYKGSSTFGSVYQALACQGFQLQCLINPMEGESRQIIQIDGIFGRITHG